MADSINQQRQYPLRPFAYRVMLVCLGMSFSTFAHAADPRLEIKRVDSEGNITQLRAKKNSTWVPDSEFCYETEFSDPKVKTSSSEWKITRATNVKVKVVDEAYSLCVHEFLSSFTVKPDPASPETFHYLLEMIPAEPSLVGVEGCKNDELTIDPKLKPGTWSVGVKCAHLPSGEIGVTVFTNKPKGRKLHAKWNDTQYATATEAVPIPRNDTVNTISIEDEAGKSFGSLEIKAFGPSSPSNPNKEKRGRIPLEVYLGLTDQSRKVDFSSTSAFNQNKSSLAMQLRAFRRAPLPFKWKVLPDLLYSANFRADLLTSNGQNVDAGLTALTPVKLFSRLSTFIGVGVQYAQSFKADYGISQVFAPGASLQVESSDLREGGRLDVATLGSKLFKVDVQGFMTPPWRFIRGFFLSADVGYLSVPKSTTGAHYDFKETRIGLQIGHRFNGDSN